MLEPSRATSSSTSSAINNPLLRLLLVDEACTGVGGGNTCCGCEEGGAIAGIDPLFEITGYEPDAWEGYVGPYISVGCTVGIDPVGVTDSTGVLDGITGGGGSPGVLLLATAGGAGGDCSDCDDGGDWNGTCRGRGLTYVRLFMASRGPLISLKEGGLMALSDG
jgi:hypothetical protein